MNLPELPANASHQDLRKVLIQMRMELHRQELRQAAVQVVRPVQQARTLVRSMRSTAGQQARTLVRSMRNTLGHATPRLLGAQGSRGTLQLLSIATILIPLLVLLLKRLGR